MGLFRPLPAVAAAALLAASLLTVAVAPVRAQGGTYGHDVSWPQCSPAGSSTTASLPASTNGSFGIVGVNGGRAFNPNPCFAAEWSWAAGLPDVPAIYMNTGNPGKLSSHWPQSGTTSPALCRKASSRSDAGCAYDYGWNAAAYAFAQAGGAASSHAWWLDVETTNSWNGTQTANAADIQGGIDYLRGQGVPSVGVYSTSYQWGKITGGYSTSTQPSYTQAWASAGIPAASVIAGASDWLATVDTRANAPSYCGSSASFTGGAVAVVQYSDPSDPVDPDYRC